MPSLTACSWTPSKGIALQTCLIFPLLNDIDLEIEIYLKFVIWNLHFISLISVYHQNL